MHNDCRSHLAEHLSTLNNRRRCPRH